MKHVKHLWQTAVATTLAVLPKVVSAAENPFNKAKNMVGDVGSAAELGDPKPVETIIGEIINIALGFLGIVLLLYLLYAGFLWMTAGGDDAQVKKARTMISQAIIGLVIIVAAFAISTFVLGSLVNATS